MDSYNFQYYSNSNPTTNEVVLVQFTKMNDGFFDAVLLEYPNYTGIMNFKDATKKRRVYSWNKIVPLNKNMFAHAETIDTEMKTVSLSIAYLEDIENTDTQTKLIQYFKENRIMTSFIKSIANLNNYNFNEIWTKLIYYIDMERIEYNKMEDENISIWKYFCDNMEEELETWIEESDLSYLDLYNIIKDAYDKKTSVAPHKITSKIGIISPDGITHTKKFLEYILKKIKFDFELKYESTPNYILESSSEVSDEEDHLKIIKMMETEGQKYEPKIFIKMIGK